MSRLNRFSNKAYLASTGRNVDEDNVFTSANTMKSSGKSTRASTKMSARDKMKQHLRLRKKQQTSRKQSPARSPLHSIDTNSPSGPYDSRKPSKKSLGTQREESLDMRNVLKRAALLIQPSPFISPPQPTESIESSEDRLFDRKDTYQVKGTDNASSQLKPKVSIHPTANNREDEYNALINGFEVETQVRKFNI